MRIDVASPAVEALREFITWMAETTFGVVDFIVSNASLAYDVLHSVASLEAA